MCIKNKSSIAEKIEKYIWIFCALIVTCATIAVLVYCNCIKLMVDRDCCKEHFLVSIALWVLVNVVCNGVKNARIKEYIYTLDSKIDSKSGVFECWYDHICQVFSFDYACAKINKDKIPKYARSFYIIKANHVNLFVSIVLVGGCWLLIGFVKNDTCWFILSFFILARMISRTMEINISFFKDIFGNEKNSTLTNSARIKLAVFSLCEEAALFSFVYYAFGNGGGSVFDSILLGMGSFIMSNGGDFEGNPFLKGVAIYQGLSAVILVTLSIANYLSLSKPADKSYFEILDMENNIGLETFQTNTIETYSKNYYDLYYTDDGYVEYLIGKCDTERNTTYDVIFTRVLFKNEKLDFSKYIKEIQNKTKRVNYTYMLANGALKTAIGTKRVFIPQALDFKKCSFGRLFTLSKVEIEDEKEREYYSDKKWWK